MKLSTQVKSISYLKANAADMVRELAEGGEPYVITQNGEAKAVVMGAAEYEKLEETMALLKIVALGRREIEAGETMGLKDAFAGVRREFGLKK